MTGGFRRVLRRLVAPFSQHSADREVQEELATHLALAADEFERQGCSPGEARRRAALALGGVDAAREHHRAARGLPSLDSIRQDLSYAIRGFRREPGFTAVAILMLAIGIGANTAVFSVVNPLLLRPLPFRDASRLVWMADARPGGLSGVTYASGIYEELVRHVESFEDTTSYFAFFGYLSYALTGSGQAERLSAVMIGPRFFEVLGVQPQAGRLFTREELAPNGPKVALLSHALWQRRFGADPGIVGRTITINDAALTVVGVMPASFDFAAVFAPGQRAELFLPAVLEDMRGWGNTLSVIARLKPGVTIERAQGELTQLMPRLVQAHRDWGPREARLTSLQAHVNGPVRRSLAVLWGAVGLVILIVCANLSNLLLARTAGRTREIALRLALGASRARVVRQLLTEGVVLSIAGGALGIVLARALTSALRASDTLSLPMLSSVTVDGQALAFTAGLAIVSGLAFGLLPALRVSNRHPQEALSEQTRGSTTSRRHAWVRGTLVASEIALACVLLVGASLLLRSFYQLMQTDLGFQPTQVSTLRLDPGGLLIDATPEQRDAAIDRRNAVLEQVMRDVGAIPGVEAVGFTDALPLDRNRTWGLNALGRDRRQGESLDAFVYVVGPGYFEAMGIARRSGRGFSFDDTRQRPGVIVVNEAAARLLWPGQDALGRIALNGDRQMQVVGVVADVKQTSLEDQTPAPQMYLPITQQNAVGSELVVRSRLTPAMLSPSLRARIAAIDQTLVMSEVKPLNALVDRAVSPRRFLLRVLGGFAGVALLLACLGIYGVVSYAVSQRVQEIGVRMALGATSGDVRRLVLGGTLRLAAIGLTAGLVLALVLSRLIATLLYGTSPTDALSFGAAAALLVAVALGAGLAPAWRASRTSPLTALRGD